jgi:hypothetical protein
MAKSKTNDTLPSADVLSKILDEYQTENADSAAARQGMGTIKKNAEKEHNVNWRMLKVAMGIQKRTDTDRAADLRHLYHYIKALGLNDQRDMYDDVGDEDLKEVMSPEDEKALESVD